MHFSAKKFFLIGFVLMLLVGIPVTVYLVQQQQELRSRAAPNTSLSFLPESSNNDPITASVDQEIPLDIMIDPGTNLVTFITLEIHYDPDKLTTASENAFVPNPAVLPTVSAGPIYTPGKVVVTLSAGNDETTAVETVKRAGTLTLRAIQNTPPDIPTQVSFSTVGTIVTSLGSSDQSNENVYNAGGSEPAIIVIADANAAPSPTGTLPEPTSPPTDPGPTSVPTDPTPTTPVVTSPPTSSGTAPVCSALTVDTTSGVAPLAVNFTANGTDGDDTINKVTLNFGDGQVSDVTSGGGIGTNAVNASAPHTYTTAGTYQATAILTDSNNGVSDTASCSQTITVSGNSSEPTPTIAPSGAAEVLVGLGAVAAFLMVAGTLIFFML